jgi:hypothetical protein
MFGREHCARMQREMPTSASGVLMLALLRRVLDGEEHGLVSGLIGR